MALDMTPVTGSVVREDRVSTVIALLPTSVQNRFSPLRHIRRSISLSSIVAPSYPCSEDVPLRPRSEGNRTPPTPGEPLATPAEQVAVDQELQAVTKHEPAMTHTADADMKDRFARQGAQLVGVSLAGVHTGRTKLGGFERDAYIDGMAYLLRGLPEGMTSHERDRLRRSMPIELLGLQSEPNGFEQAQTQPSALYRITSSLALRFVIALSIMLPYLLLLLRWLAGLERKYKISESLGQYTLYTMNSLAYHGGRMIQASRGQDWRIGQLLVARLVWTLEEVSRGVADGVDRGLSGVRAES